MHALATVSLLVLVAPSAAAQQRLGVFDAPMVITDEHHVMTKLADLDGDGDMDAIGFWSETQASTGTQTGQLTAWLNDGLGKLVQTWELQPVLPYHNSGSIAREAVGDLNGDGRADYVLVIDDSVNVYYSNGALPPTLQSFTTAIPQVIDVCIGDFTGDGKLDFVLAATFKMELYEFAVPFGVVYLANALNGTWTITNLIPCEATGDGVLDFSACNGYQAHFFTVTGGTIQDTGSLYNLVEAMPMMTAGDIDGDGDDDLVCFGMGDYTVLRRIGPAQWQLESPRLGGPATILADVDGDGDLDGACCGGGGGGWTNTRYNTSPSIFRVTLNNGTGNFAPAIEIPGLGSAHIAGVADLENDGDMDLVAGRCVYYPPSPIRGPVVTQATVQVPEGNTLVDVDCDGDLDFKLGLGGTFINQGDGSTLPAPILFPPAPAGTSWIGLGFPGDFDGDGDVDLYLGLQSGGVTSLELLENRGGGSFVHGVQALAVAPSSLSPRFGFTGDIDNDGDLDLAYSTESWGLGTTFYLNDGTGRLAQAGTAISRLMGLADINGDQRLDLLQSQGQSSVIFYALNQGGLSFTSLSYIPGTFVVNATDRYAVADLDGDGDLDIAAIVVGSGSLHVYLNDGQANFTDQVLGGSYLSTSPRIVVSLDADCDGRMDLVCGYIGTAIPAVDVYLRKHDNSGWNSPVRQAVFRIPTAVGFNACDVDGDGDPDLVNDKVVYGRQYIPATSGRRKQIGTADAGSGGFTPTLGASGPFRSGQTITLRLTGARPLTSGRLFLRDTTQGTTFPVLGLHPAAARGLTLVVPVTTSAGDGFDGSGAWTLSANLPTSFAGRTLRYDAVLFDPAGPNGRVRTNGLELVFGP